MEPAPLFSNVDIDIFGPGEVKSQPTTSTRRDNVYVKHWALIATRLSSRAMDLEIISPMDTGSIINVF